MIRSKAETHVMTLGMIFSAVFALIPGRVNAGAAGAPGVKVEKWAAGLAGPQGLVLDQDGKVLVVEHDAGRVRRLPRSGLVKDDKADIAAEGLLSPSFAFQKGPVTYVAERKGNSIAKLSAGAKLERLTGEIVDPLGIAVAAKQADTLLVVSHRQSLVLSWIPSGSASPPKLAPDPVLAPKAGTKYGWRDLLVLPDGTMLITDEVAGAVWRKKPGQDLAVWATGLSSPSGLALSPAGAVFVTEEGTGRLTRLAADGKGTMIAEGLGAAREALFLDARTVLVSDRKGGDVWKITLAK